MENTFEGLSYSTSTLNKSSHLTGGPSLLSDFNTEQIFTPRWRCDLNTEQIIRLPNRTEQIFTPHWRPKLVVRLQHRANLHTSLETSNTEQIFTPHWRSKLVIRLQHRTNLHTSLEVQACYQTSILNKSSHLTGGPSLLSDFQHRTNLHTSLEVQACYQTSTLNKSSHLTGGPSLLSDFNTEQIFTPHWRSKLVIRLQHRTNLHTSLEVQACYQTSTQNKSSHLTGGLSLLSDFQH
ncbi:unnamed protein product [Mytilus edulis]|uniref:Uncharacterized protein n=1 Tax=Mytilus edulis TaxID=6550 RepID=A0A8S3TZC5_MYTED|nr:unnamed protein product [Mytilus edulis]